MDLKQNYIIFFIGIFSGFSQNDSLQNRYFKSYEESATASLYYLDTSNNFDIIFMSEGEKIYLNLVPNKREQIGVNLSYKFIDISYGYSPSFFAENKDNDDSKLFSFGTRLQFKKWMQSITFINQKGFFISEDNLTASFPRFRSTKIGGTTSYIFNENFSYKAITSQKEWQTKSSGSFIPNFSFYYTNLDLNDGSDNTQSDIYVASLAPSYFYNLVLNNRFLASAGISAGIGFNVIDKEVSALYELDASMKLAYNTNTFFTFINANYINFIQNATTAIRLNDNISILKVALGYRFNPPKKVKEVYDNATKKIRL
ncbi:MAG: DUF4421 family protein [Bacteroidota bacterium]